MFDMLMMNARSCKNPFPIPIFFLLQASKRWCKINDRKTANRKILSMKFPQNDFKINNGWKGKRDPVQIHQMILLQPDFAIWFFTVFFRIHWTIKKIQIEFTKSVTRQVKKIPDFDMLIKISVNRFSFGGTFSLMFT